MAKINTKNEIAILFSSSNVLPFQMRIRLRQAHAPGVNYERGNTLNTNILKYTYQSGGTDSNII